MSELDGVNAMTDIWRLRGKKDREEERARLLKTLKVDKKVTLVMATVTQQQVM